MDKLDEIAKMHFQPIWEDGGQADTFKLTRHGWERFKLDLLDYLAGLSSMKPEVKGHTSDWEKSQYANKLRQRILSEFQENGRVESPASQKREGEL